MMEEFVNMDPKSGTGQVYDTRTFADYFGSIHSMITKYLASQKAVDNVEVLKERLEESSQEGVTNSEKG